MTPTDEARIEEAFNAYISVDGDLPSKHALLAALAPTLAELADMTAKVERLEAELELADHDLKYPRD